MWMVLHALAQYTPRPLLALQQKQGPQRAGISNRDGEEEGVHRDSSVYWALEDVRLEERVKGVWYVCVLRTFLGIDSSFYSSHAFRVTLTLSRLHGAEPDHATW